MKKIIEIIDKFVFKGPPFILFFTGLYFNLQLFNNLTEDTTNISNVAFGIAAVMAGLSMRMASTLNNDDPVKDKFLYSGERFFHSAILLLSASIIKYATISIKSIAYFKQHIFADLVVTFPLHFLFPVLFFFALNSAHSGMKICNNVLWSRVNRIKDWDNLL